MHCPIALNRQAVQLLNCMFTRYCSQVHSCKIGTMSHSSLYPPQKFFIANLHVPFHLHSTASDIFHPVTDSRISVRFAKFTKTFKVPQNVGTTYLKLILAVGAVNLFSQLPGILRLML